MFFTTCPICKKIFPYNGPESISPINSHWDWLSLITFLPLAVWVAKGDSSIALSGLYSFAWFFLTRESIASFTWSFIKLACFPIPHSTIKRDIYPPNFWTNWSVSLSIGALGSWVEKLLLSSIDMFNSFPYWSISAFESKAGTNLSTPTSSLSSSGFNTLNKKNL